MLMSLNDLSSHPNYSTENNAPLLASMPPRVFYDTALTRYSNRAPPSRDDIDIQQMQFSQAHELSGYYPLEYDWHGAST